MPYEKVCKAFEALDSASLTNRRGIQEAPLSKIKGVLKGAGFRFPNQTGEFIKKFGDNPIDLTSATREELIAKIPGIGMKLSSMFLRNTRGEKHAVIDIHLKRFLAERGLLTNDYLKDEMSLKKIAKEMGLTIAELDFAVWEERRIGNKKKNKSILRRE